ncbi:hypothetical protein [Cellulomonas hominis]
MTMTDAARASAYDAMLGALERRILSRATGADVPTGTRLSDETRRRLWLGMLGSEPALIAQATNGRVNTDRAIPPAQGFSFQVADLPCHLDLTVNASVYLGLHPTFDEQAAFVQDDADTHTPPAGTPAPQPAAPGFKLAPVWTKVDIGPVHISVDLDASHVGAIRVGSAELSAAFAAAVHAPPGAQLFRPRRQTTPAGTLPRQGDLTDAVTWDAYAAANLEAVAQVVAPTFSAAVQIDAMPADGTTEILVSLVNTTPAIQLYDGVHAYDQRYVDLHLYEAELAATTDTTLVPAELEQVAQSYRYDRTVPAFGHACPVDVTQDKGLTTLRTLFAATEPTWRTHPRQVATNGAGEQVRLDTTFDTVIDDPVAAVRNLLDAHRAWTEDAWSPAALDALAAAHGWDAAARADAEADAALARAEVDWLAAGVDLLEKDADVKEAFVVANRAMAASAGGAYDSWRAFQLAWIVGCLPAMVDPVGHPDVSIVWFATGGGKSEAYLGLMMTTLFYGRLKGVSAGVQVWARFPLRLLALQQTERFASAVLHGEVLRRTHPRMQASTPLGIGYFVGGGNTPNKLYKPSASNPFYRGQDPAAPETAEACRVLATCPLCATPLEVRWHEPKWQMQHICPNAGCALSGVLPVWGVDDDIYRAAPAVLVGTVDKLAQLGQSVQFQTLLGRVHSVCPQHGYTAKPDYCDVFGCTAQRGPVPAGFGHLRLEIADELHLLDESLGALDGMYESLLQGISAELGHEPIQIVAATATIEGYANQVQHLYRRGARRFPASGPQAGETFWSVTRHGDPLRRYVGVRPRGITMVTASREITVDHATWVRDLVADPASVLAEAGLDPADPELLALAAGAGADLYEVLVAYCLRNEDLTSYIRDEKVVELLDAQDNLAIISGDTDPGVIREAVARLVNPPTDAAARVRLIAATKAIGHGFDVARLGVMVAMGTPTQAAEIIQASARVGRRHPGLVVNVINPSRDRDASVYRYYATWIRFLDRLVHKVPVNRESVPILRRVLPGGLMAWLLQTLDRGWVTGGRRRKSLATSSAFADALSTGYLTRDELVRLLTVGFGIDPTSDAHRLHRNEIGRWVDDHLASVPLQADASTRLSALLHPAVPRSLRDIEEPITILGDV